MIIDYNKLYPTIEFYIDDKIVDMYQIDIPDIQIGEVYLMHAFDDKSYRPTLIIGINTPFLHF